MRNEQWIQLKMNECIGYRSTSECSEYKLWRIWEQDYSFRSKVYIDTFLLIHKANKQTQKQPQKSIQKKKKKKKNNNAYTRNQTKNRP